MNYNATRKCRMVRVMLGPNEYNKFMYYKGGEKINIFIEKCVTKAVEYSNNTKCFRREAVLSLLDNRTQYMNIPLSKELYTELDKYSEILLVSIGGLLRDICTGSYPREVYDEREQDMLNI